jgi:ABC-2 type transport system ATP-binding protein
MSQRGTGSSWAPVVSFEGVSKVYGQVRAVDGLSLDLRHGQTVAFLGPNGAGKYKPLVSRD